MRRVGRYGNWRVTWQRPGWVATSCLFHTLLVVALILFRPTAERSRVRLQVRLMEDAHHRPQIVEPAPAPPPVVRQKASPPKRPDLVKTPTPAGPREQFGSHACCGRRGDAGPNRVADPSTVASHVRASNGRGNGAAWWFGGKGDWGGAAEKMGGRNGSGGGGPTSGGSSAKTVVESVSGVFIVSGAGNGKGLAGSENGAGIGSGLGVGRGDGQGEGISKGAGSGNGAGSGDGAGYGSGHGDGTGVGVADLLRSIRQRIEKAKTYPEIARRQGKQGTVELRFRIAADGTVEVVEIVHSSGHQTLDESSMQTIHRAGPYPPVGGWVRIPLSYRLER